MQNDDPKDVERDLKRPAIDSWTENDPPEEMKKKHRATVPRRKEKPSGLDDAPQPGTGRPDAEETYQGKAPRWP